MQSIETCLMFTGEQVGKAEEAIRLYTSLFENSEILDITYDPNTPKGSETPHILISTFTINHVKFRAMDNSYEHKFNFTPAVSLFVECESLEELEKVHDVLAEGGKILMPLDNYGFSQKFCWLDDKYGVSWQLNCM